MRPAHCSKGQALRLILWRTSHGDDNSTTHLSGALHSSTTTMLPSLLSDTWEQERLIKMSTREMRMERGWANGKVWFMNTSLDPVFTLPGSLLGGGGKQCQFLWGNVCVVGSFVLPISLMHRNTVGEESPCLSITYPSLLLLCLSAQRSICADFLKGLRGVIGQSGWS